MRRRLRMKKSNQKNSIERIIKDPTYTIYSKGGVAKNGSKPTQSGDNKPSNVVPFPMPNDAPLNEWYKTASRDDVLQLLNRVYGLKFLKGLSEKELGELLDYTIDTGGFGV